MVLFSVEKWKRKRNKGERDRERGDLTCYNLNIIDKFNDEY